MKKSFAEGVRQFYRNLDFSVPVPEKINVLNPYRDEIARSVSSDFFRKYYNDMNTRTMILGINPGRFGAGVTGITFTDPVRLEKVCGIPNSFEKRPELSSVFIYEMIGRYGGAERFYSRYYLTAVCPLGFTRDGKNLNFYDDRKLEIAVTPFIIDSIQKQIQIGCREELAFCLGEGLNYRYLQKINEQCHFFRKIIPLAHPRYIMQYRLKKKEEYIIRYLDHLGNGEK